MFSLHSVNPSSTGHSFTGVLDVFSGDQTARNYNSLASSSNVREKGSPALRYLLEMIQEPGQMEESQFRPVPRFDKRNKYNFFSSLKH